MAVVESCLFFIVGICFGSFLNVIGLRTPMKISFLYGRSKCPKCTRNLNWYELIPICSFLLQHGKCRRCHTNIPLLYPLVELVTGILFCLMYVHFGLTLELLGALLLISLCVIVFVTDLTYMVIPNQILFFFLPLFILFRLIYPLENWHSSVFGSVVGFLLIGSIIYISRGGMGAGDMKLLALFGILLGFHQILLTFFIAVCAGSIIGILLIISKRKTSRQAVPFAPFLGIAAIVSYIFGDNLITIYLSMLGI